MRRYVPVLIVLVGWMDSAALLYADSGAARALYVATTGSDSWSGRLPVPNSETADGPLATLEAACAEARKLGKEQPRKIVVQPGRYFLDEPLELSDQDTGLTVESAPGAKVSLIGGRMVTGWKKSSSGKWIGAFGVLDHREK